jgi:hypothetical protein
MSMDAGLVFSPNGSGSLRLRSGILIPLTELGRVQVGASPNELGWNLQSLLGRLSALFNGYAVLRFSVNAEYRIFMGWSEDSPILVIARSAPSFGKGTASIESSIMTLTLGLPTTSTST